jgi:hypothetical protein
MKVLKIGDIITIKHEEVEVDITPLTHAQKMEIRDCVTIQGGKEFVDNIKSSMLAMAYSIKAVRGITDFGDNEYKLAFEDKENNKLTENCTSELLSAFSSSSISTAINYVLAGRLPDLEGVEIKVSPKK